MLNLENACYHSAKYFIFSPPVINLENKVFLKYNFILFYVSRKCITLSGANMVVGYLRKQWVCDGGQ